MLVLIDGFVQDHQFILGHWDFCLHTPSCLTVHLHHSPRLKHLLYPTPLPLRSSILTRWIIIPTMQALHHEDQPVRINISNFIKCNNANIVGLPASTEATGFS